jgi:type VI secretion system secreted protein VgrG
VAWASGLLLLGSLLAAVGALVNLARARRQRYFQLRRGATLWGWRLVFYCLIMLVGAGVVSLFGQSAIEMFVPPTLTLTPSPTPTPTVPTPTPTLTPSITPTPSITLTPSHTLPPSETPTPTLTPFPVLPLAFITPPGTVTVTPLPNAVAANLRFARRSDCTVPLGLDVFDALPKPIYAHFEYDNWTRGAQWSGVWYQDAEVFFVETHIWDGSTGGCGFTNYDNGGQPWPVGGYEVQVFIGQTWLLSGRFTIVPAPTPTPTRTPRPTATLTVTRTPRPTRTATLTRTPRPTATATVTP